MYPNTWHLICVNPSGTCCDHADSKEFSKLSTREKEGLSIAGAVTTPRSINPDLHVPSTSQVSTPTLSQSDGTRIATGRLVDEPQLQPRTVTSVFPTVVISQSTPKPTPPDTPARCLSPTVFQALTPLHALSIAHALSPPPIPATTPSPTSNQTDNISISSSPSLDSPPTTSSSTTVISTTASLLPLPMTSLATSRMLVPETFNSYGPHSIRPILGAKPLLPTTNVRGKFDDGNEPPLPKPALPEVSGSRPLAPSRVPISTAPPAQGVSHHRMFFLQRNSNSFSPDSNSGSHSHSRSPVSPTRSHRRNRNSRLLGARSPSGSRSPDSIKGKEGLVTYDRLSRAKDHRAGAKVRSAGENETSVSHSPRLLQEATVQSRSGEDGTRIAMSEIERARPESHVAERMDQVVQILNDPAPQSSCSPHTPALPNRSQRFMTRNRRPHRSHLGRTLDRSSSRTGGRFKGSEGSVGSRVSVAACSLDGQVGSANVSGMGSGSTSSSSRLVMGKLNRLRPDSKKPSDKENQSVQQQVRDLGETTTVTNPSTRHSQHQPQRMSPLAAIPDPQRLEVLERQVATLSGGNQRRAIALESDSEDEESSDEEEDCSDGDSNEKSARNDSKVEEEIVEENDGSSWSDEDSGNDEAEIVVLPAKRTQTAGVPQPPVRRESREQDHEHAGSEDGPRQGVHFHDHAKPSTQLPHVKSKTKLTPHQNLPYASPPARQPPARKSAATRLLQAQGRTSQSSGDLLAQAAREARRQQDMFVPLARETYSSNNLVREKSLTSLSRGGRPSNLTLLLNPDPQWFPQNHPYREEKARDPADHKLSRSMEEINARSTAIKTPRPGTGLGFGGLRMTSTTTNTPQSTRHDSAPAQAAAAVVAPPSPAPLAQPKTRTPRSSPPKDVPKSPPPPFKLRAYRSTAAVPVMLGVTASSAPRDEKKGDMLEMSLRQMGARQQRQPRHVDPDRPVRPLARLSVHSSDKSADSRPANSARGNRLGARPTDIELSESDSDEPSPPPKDQGAAGRSLAKEHLEAVMGGKDTAQVKAGLSASRTILASPDALPPIELASYRPPAPPSSPSVDNPYEAKRAEGHLPHTPTRTRPPGGRSNRPRPHSSVGLPPPTEPTPGPSQPIQRDRRPQATSQPPVPVSIEPQEVPFPYNLPYPGPPQSPRTIRLKMLSTEVPDDLRRDLLWERKTNRIVPILNNNNPAGYVPKFQPMSTLCSPQGQEAREDAQENQDERLQREREARERYERMRTRTWNGVIYQRNVW